MTKRLPKYAGLAAVTVLLVGWFILGNATVRLEVLVVAAFISRMVWFCVSVT